MEREEKKIVLMKFEIGLTSLFFRNGIRLELKWKHRIFKLDKQMEGIEKKRDQKNCKWNVSWCGRWKNTLKMSPWKQRCDLHTILFDSMDAYDFYYFNFKSIIICHVWLEFRYEFGLTLKWGDRKTNAILQTKEATTKSQNGLCQNVNLNLCFLFRNEKHEWMNEMNENKQKQCVWENTPKNKSNRIKSIAHKK